MDPLDAKFDLPQKPAAGKFITKTIHTVRQRTDAEACLLHRALAFLGLAHAAAG